MFASRVSPSLRCLCSIFLAFAVALCNAAISRTAVASTPVQSAAVAALRPAAQANRVEANANFSPQTQLTGHLPRWVSLGQQVPWKVIDTTAPLHVTLVLQRDSAVQAAFEQLLADQQNPSSQLYHQWLTPQQVGQLYGLTDSDLTAVTSWLTSQGLTVDVVANSRVTIEAHGSTAAVGNAFRTGFGYFSLNGEPRLSATSEPYIPTALVPVIRLVSGLTEIPLRPLNYLSAPRKPHSAPSSIPTANPDMTLSNEQNDITPGDFAVIYDLNSVYTGGNRGATLGAGTNHVAIIGRSRVATTDISEWATNVGISGYSLNTIIPTTGTDPGSVCTFANVATCSTAGDQGEQTLDVDRVVGTAPGVTADLVVSLTSQTTDGVYIAAAYEVNTVVDPVMTISYGSCEANNGSAGVNLWANLFSTAVAEGISVFVSSGDSGANGCANSGTNTTATGSDSINAICSSQYATCVGGTEFADTANPSTYWSPYASGSNNTVTALSYIPEGAWNEPLAGGTSSTASGCGPTGTGYCPLATGGGASGFLAKPSWQTGTGVPADNARDVPDVAFSASLHDSYYTCLDFQLGLYASQGIISSDNCTAAGGGYFFGVGGTSATAPSMAGIAALLNSRAGKAQGNLNPTLYSVASGASGSTAFHDATVATSGVTSCVITTPSMCDNSTPGTSADSTSGSGGVQGYLLTTGYDLATGLGSLDVAKFLAAAVASTISTTTTMSATPNTVLVNSATTLKATITPASGTTAMTGTVQFYLGSVAVANVIGSAVPVSNNSASTSYTPSTAGGDIILAVYSGDPNYTTSTSAGISLIVSPGFTVTAATTSYSASPGVISGTSVTDAITVSSVAPFSSAVALTCQVTIPTQSDTAAGTCSLSPASVTPASGGSVASTLTINTKAGTSGTLNVIVTGNSGAATSKSATIVLLLTAPSFTIATTTPTLSVAGGQTTTGSVTVTSVNGFAGTVILTCAASNKSGTAAGSCPAVPSVTLAANGSAVASVPVNTAELSTGTLGTTIVGAGTTIGATLPATASCGTVSTPCMTFTLGTPFTLSPTAVPATGTLVAGVTSATSVITFTSLGYAGTATPACTVTNSTGAAAGSCTFTPVTLTANGTTTSTVSISTTSGTTGTLTARVTGSATAGGINFTAASSAVISLTTVQPFSMSAPSLTLTSGATTGNSDTVTLSAAPGFVGPVTLGCSINGSSPAYVPTCAVSPSPFTVPAGGTGTVLATVNSHATTTQVRETLASLGGSWRWSLGLVGILAAFTMKRRRAFRLLALVPFLFAGITALSGCASGSPKTTTTSAGTYTVTVTGTSNGYTETTTFNLTINQ